MMVLTIYKLNVSPPARAVLMILEAINYQDAEYVDVNLMAGEHLTEDYLKMNPQHSVPTLKDDDFIIWDSHAIAAYLVTKYAEEDTLYPSDHKSRAVIDQRLHFDSGILFPTLRNTVAPIFFGNEKSVHPDNLDKIDAAYDICERFLTSHVWFAGDGLSIADICAVATVSSMDAIVTVDADKYPNLAAWLDRCSKQDFYIKANAPGLTQFCELLKSKLE